MATDNPVHEERDFLAEREARVDRVIALLRKFFEREDLETKRQRERFAKRCGTTWGNLQQIIQRQRNIPVWLAVNLDRESDGELPMTELSVEVDPRHRIDWEYVRKSMRRKAAKA